MADDPLKFPTIREMMARVTFEDKASGLIPGEMASTYQDAKGFRQMCYQLMKMVPEYKPFYDEAQDIYERLSAAMGVDTEPVFDQEEYEKSDRHKAIMEGRA